MPDSPTQPMEDIYLPIPAWLAADMEKPVLGMNGKSPVTEDRVLAKTNLSEAVISSFAHRIPPEARRDIIREGFALVYEKTLEIRGDARVCKFIGIGVSYIARTVVDLADFDPEEDKAANAADPPPANGPIGIVEGP